MPTGIYDRTKSKSRIKKQFCIRGHNINLEGRTSGRSCVVCNREDTTKWHLEHPVETSTAIKKWQQSNPLKVRSMKYLKRYGITIDDYNKMFNDQDGRCAICQIPQSEFKKSLFVDHDHATGKVRGLLCYQCNTKVGILENKEFCLKVDNYLQK